MLLIDFQALDPERHLLELDLRSKFEVHGVPLRVQQQSLLRLVFADELEIEHAATVDPSGDQPRLLLVEVGEAYQSYLEWNRLYVVQMLVKYVQLEVC